MRKLAIYSFLLVALIVCLPACTAERYLSGGGMASPQIDSHEASIYVAGADTPNLAMYGATTMQKDGWLYYSAQSCVYRTNDDFHTLYRVTDHPAHSIQVMGSWMYYLATEIDESLNDPFAPVARQYNLRRVRVDGSEDQSLGVDDVYRMTVINDWIYYLPNDTHHLWRMKVDGSERTQLTTERTMIPLTDGASLYVAVRTGDNVGLFHVDPDGVAIQRLSDARTFCYAIDRDWLYYADSSAGDTHLLRRVRLDGSGDMALDGIQSHQFAIYEGYLYYIVSSRDEVMGEDRYFKRRNLDTGVDETLWDRGDTGFEIAGDWIYLQYSPSAFQYVPFRMRLDGSDITPLR